MEARSKLMKYRELGNTGIRVSELGFGCASIWGKPFFPENEAIELFLAAYETGINFYDTGFSYDEAEVRLGKCVERLGIENRDKIVIATKCGTRISDTGKCYHDWNPEWLKQSVEISLRRLGTSYVDMLHLHGPSISDISDSVLKLLDDMKSDGIVKAVGVNSFDTDVLEFILSQKYFDFVMLDYNILRQDREDLIARLHDSGIGVIGGAALAQSLFSGRIFNIRNRIDIWYLLRALKNWRKQIVTGGGVQIHQFRIKYYRDSDCTQICA